MTERTFKAMLLREEGGRTSAAIERLSLDALPGEDTLVAIDYSSINYKDALAVTGRGKIVKAWPLIPGADLAGTVVESTLPSLAAGQKVILTGWGVGEKYWGGFSQYQRVRGDWLVPLPQALTTREAMMVGTAGLTAMLCVAALEATGVAPAGGPVLVTGASGGVGSVAIALLSQLGYTVAALTRDPGKQAYLKRLGASEFVDGTQWSEAPRPLEAQRWAAAIDTVGSNVLARVLAQTNYGGAVAACGLAGGADLPTTVMPFILRGVKLLGVDSVMQPREARIAAWQRIARELPKSLLDEIVTQTVSLDEVTEASNRLLTAAVLGRVLVDVNRE